MISYLNKLRTYIKLSFKIYLCILNRSSNITSRSFLFLSPLLHKKNLIEADIDLIKIKPSYVQTAVFFITLLVAFLVIFLCRWKDFSLTLALPDLKKR